MHLVAGCWRFGGLRLITANFGQLVVGCKKFWVVSDSFAWFRVVLAGFGQLRVVFCFRDYQIMPDIKRYLICDQFLVFHLGFHAYCLILASKKNYSVKLCFSTLVPLILQMTYCFMYSFKTYSLTGITSSYNK